MSIYAFQIPQNDGQFHPLYFDGFFSPEECDQILALYENEETWAGGVVESDGSGMDDNAIRRVDINTVHLEERTKWIYDKINDLVHSANQTYQFDLVGFMENMQLLKYTEPQGENVPGGHYNVHMDTGPSYLSTRKLTVIVQLTDPSEYEGCDVEVTAYGYANKGKGDVLIFPSCMLHSVSELTQGHREALVVWVNGPPFR